MSFPSLSALTLPFHVFLFTATVFDVSVADVGRCSLFGIASSHHFVPPKSAISVEEITTAVWLCGEVHATMQPGSGVVSFLRV